MNNSITPLTNLLVACRQSVTTISGFSAKRPKVREARRQLRLRYAHRAVIGITAVSPRAMYFPSWKASLSRPLFDSCGWDPLCLATPFQVST